MEGIPSYKKLVTQNIHRLALHHVTIERGLSIIVPDGTQGSVSSCPLDRGASPRDKVFGLSFVLSRSLWSLGVDCWHQ